MIIFHADAPSDMVQDMAETGMVLEHGLIEWGGHTDWMTPFTNYSIEAAAVNNQSGV